MSSLAAVEGCTPLPDDTRSDVEKGTKRPDRRRPDDDDTTGKRDAVDPCKNFVAAGSDKQSGDTKSTILFQSDFETPNRPLKANCGEWLDQSPINDLFGTKTFQFAQAETVEGVLLKDAEGVYTDPSGRGGDYAIGMLSSVQEDRLAMSFETDLPYINLRIDVSGIAIQGCGTSVPISKPRLKVDLYDVPVSALTDLKRPAVNPIDSKVIEGKDVADAWVFDWRTANVVFDTSAARGTARTLIFDLLEGGYVAMDNLSVVASTERGVVDADNNGVPDDVQCAGEGEGAADDDAAPPQDAGTAAPAAPTPAAPTPAAPAASTPTATTTTPPQTAPTQTSPASGAGTGRSTTPPEASGSGDSRTRSDDDTPPARNNDGARDGGVSIIDAIRDIVDSGRRSR